MSRNTYSNTSLKSLQAFTKQLASPDLRLAELNLRRHSEKGGKENTGTICESDGANLEFAFLSCTFDIVVCGAWVWGFVVNAVEYVDTVTRAGQLNDTTYHEWVKKQTY